MREVNSANSLVQKTQWQTHDFHLSVADNGQVKKVNKKIIFLKVLLKSFSNLEGASAPTYQYLGPPKSILANQAHFGLESLDAYCNSVNDG